MRLFFSLVFSFLAAVVLASVVASLFSSQFVVAGLQAVGADIDFNSRLSMTLNDLAVIQILSIVIAGGFLVGFVVAYLGHSRLGGSGLLWFTIAGAAAWPCTLMLMSYVLQLMPLAGARSALGLLTQAIAGGIGGYCFARLTNKAEERSHV